MFFKESYFNIHVREELKYIVCVQMPSVLSYTLDTGEMRPSNIFRSLFGKLTTSKVKSVFILFESLCCDSATYQVLYTRFIRGHLIFAVFAVGPLSAKIIWPRNPQIQ